VVGGGEDKRRRGGRGCYGNLLRLTAKHWLAVAYALKCGKIRWWKLKHLTGWNLRNMTLQAPGQCFKPVTIYMSYSSVIYQLKRCSKHCWNIISDAAKESWPVVSRRTFKYNSSGNLSGFYFRYKNPETNKWENWCFEDLPEETQDEYLKDRYEIWLRYFVKELSKVINEIGEAFDLVR
jgi:hypothetical protein